MNSNDLREYLRDPAPVELHYFAYGVSESTSDLAAVLLYDLASRISRQKKKLIRGRRQWTFDAMRVFAEVHPYASEAGIRKAFKALEKAGYVQIEKSGKWNGKRYDKKWWYHVTSKGAKAAKLRRMRFVPAVAVELKIPKAVLLQKFRYEFHKESSDDWVPLDPATLGIPYSPRTIERHLDGLVSDGILERHPDDPNQYRIGLEKDEPLTVSPGKLLPTLQMGEIGLLVGHTGTGKTSLSSFIAVQSALAGYKVLYLSLEEPAQSIVNRMYSQESAATYTDLHRGDTAAWVQVNSTWQARPSRLQTIGANLKVIGFGSRKLQTHEILDELTALREQGYVPDLVIVDQLEWITVEYDVINPDCAEVSPKRNRGIGKAIPPASLIPECLGGLNCQTWVLHQVVGECEWEFPESDVAGGEDVLKHFDCVVGVGRKTKDSPVIRLFSMTTGKAFEQVLDADFPHMRFRPRK